MPSEQSADLTPLQHAISMCNVQGRCDCGKTVGHAGWLLCVQRLLRKDTDHA